MISLQAVTLVLLILLIHWVADFVCQTDWQAKNKSTSLKALLSHTVSYSAVWLVMSYFSAWIATSDGVVTMHVAKAIWQFIIITFVAHTVTDYFTSKITKRLLDKKKVHDFFVVVGIDQWLHYFQLLVTYFWVTQNIIYV